MKKISLISGLGGFLGVILFSISLSGCKENDFIEKVKGAFESVKGSFQKEVKRTEEGIREKQKTLETLGKILRNGPSEKKKKKMTSNPDEMDQEVSKEKPSLPNSSPEGKKIIDEQRDLQSTLSRWRILGNGSDASARFISNSGSRVESSFDLLSGGPRWRSLLSEPGDKPSKSDPSGEPKIGFPANPDHDSPQFQPKDSKPEDLEGNLKINQAPQEPNDEPIQKSEYSSMANQVVKLNAAVSNYRRDFPNDKGIKDNYDQVDEKALYKLIDNGYLTRDLEVTDWAAYVKALERFNAIQKDMKPLAIPPKGSRTPINENYLKLLRSYHYLEGWKFTDKGREKIGLKSADSRSAQKNEAIDWAVNLFNAAHKKSKRKLPLADPGSGKYSDHVSSKDIEILKSQGYLLPNGLESEGFTLCDSQTYMYAVNRFNRLSKENSGGKKMIDPKSPVNPQTLELLHKEKILDEDGFLNKNPTPADISPSSKDTGWLGN